MTFENCKKVIENKKAKLNDEDYQTFASDMLHKLDVFLLNNRISKAQYDELVELV